MPQLLDPFYQEENENKDLDYFARQTDVQQGYGPLHSAVAKKQAAMTAIIENGNVAAQYKKILEELEYEGRSTDVDQLKVLSQMELEEGDIQTAEAIITDPTLDKDQKVKILFDIQKEAEARVPRTEEEIFTSEMMLRATTTTGQEDRVHQGFFHNEAAIAKSNSQIEELKRSEVLTWEADTGNAMIDFTSTALLPGFGIKLKQIVDEVLPEEGPAWHNILPGESVAEFKRTFRDANPEDRVEMAKKVLNLIDEYSTLIHNNDFEAYDFVNTLIGDLNPSDTSIEIDRWINNAFGVLDLVPAIGTGIRAGIGMWRRVSRSSPLSHTASAAPKDAAEMSVRALKDAEVADIMDTNAEEIISTAVLPSPPTEARRAFPDIGDRLNVAEYLDTDPTIHGINYTAAEKVAAQERTIDRMRALEQSEGKVLLNTTDIEAIPGGYQTHFTIGHTKDYGFESPEAARDAVQDFLEVQSGAKLDYLKKDYETGEWKPAVPGDTTPGEYLAQVNVKHIYNPEDVLGASLDDAVIGVTGDWAKYLDKSSVFSRWITEAGNVAADKSAFLRTQLESKLQPLLKLSGSGQSQVFKALDEGDSFIDDVTGQQGKWFTREELVEKFNGDEGLIQAYYSVKDHQEVLYELQNYRLRSRLEQSGFREIQNEEGGFLNVGKPLEREAVDPSISRVYDPDSGTMIDIDPDQIAQLYESGGRLASLRSREVFGDEMYDHVILRSDTNTGIQDLPQYVLNKREGYITRIYDTNYVVKKKRTGVKVNGRLVKPEPGATFNGKPLKEGDMLVAVKMAGSKGEALRAAKSLARANTEEGVELGVVEAKELRDVEYARQMDYDFYRDKGQLYFSPRGVEIESVSGARTIEGIAESLDKARRSVSRHVAMDDFLNSSTTRWEKRYGQAFGVGPDRRMPMPPQAIPRPADPALLKDWQNAIALRDHIAMVSGIDASWYKSTWRKMAIAVADRIAGTADSRFFLKAREKSAKYVLENRDRGIIELAKMAAFTRFIALNPARQLLLQSQQATVYLGLDHGLKYFASGRGIRDYTGLTTGLMLRDTRYWRDLAPTAAKGMGMSTKEYTEFVDAFRRSGLQAAIDSHPFANALALGRNAAAAESPFFAALNRQGERMKSVIRTARKIGFDAGEYNNISTAWLAVRNKWIKANPGKNWADPDVLDQISGEARAVALNMNPAGALAYQKGTMGLITQFMSHATKSAQLLVPERLAGKTIGKLSNKAFSGKERFRIAMMQLGLYGTGGFGLWEGYTKLRDELGFDVSPDVNTVVREGVAGSLVNAAFHAADVEGEQADVEFSKNFGPFSGTLSATPISKLGRAIVDGIFLNPVDSQSLRQIGAGLSLPADIAQAVEASLFIAGVGDVPGLDDPERFALAMQEWTRLLPAYNNYVKARFAQESGKFATRSGSSTVQATAGEALAQMMFGIRGHREVAVGDMLNELRQYTVVKDKGLDTALQETGNTLYKNTLRLARQLDTGEVTHAMMIDISKREREALKVALGEEQFFRVMHHFQRRVFSDLNKDNESKLAEMLITYYSRGVIPLESRTSTRLRNMPEFEGKNEIIKWVEASLESRVREVE